MLYELYTLSTNYNSILLLVKSIYSYQNVFVRQMHMTLESFVVTYGYAALLAGVLVEGETIVLVAGYLAHNGYLSLPFVMLISFLGAFAADQFFFHLGAVKGTALLESRPKWQTNVQRVRNFLVRYHTIAILTYRFIYGTRTITPIIIGMSGFARSRFIALNLCSTFIWAIIVSAGGYFFGHLIQLVMAEAEQFQKYILLGIGMVSLVIYLFHHLRR